MLRPEYANTDLKHSRPRGMEMALAQVKAKSIWKTLARTLCQ